MEPGIVPLCLLLCTGVEQCTVEVCRQEMVSITEDTLKINCIHNQLFNLSVFHPSDLVYRTVHILNCDLTQLDDLDTRTLREGNVRNLVLESVTPPKSLLPLKELTNKLEVLSIVGSTLKNEMINSLPVISWCTELNISSNSLSSLPASLQLFPRLTRLDASQNKFTSLDSAQLPVTIVDLIFRENLIQNIRMTKVLEELEMLDLSQNMITNLNWFIDSTIASSCSRINLSNNQILAVEPENIDFLTDLKSYDLSHNNISKLYKLIEVDNIVENTIDLSENPLHCSCQTVYFAKNVLWQSQRLPTCLKPASIVGTSLEFLLANSECGVTKPEGLISEKENDLSGITIVSLCVIGGVLCGVAAVAGVGFIMQRRQLSGIVTAKNPLQSKLDLDSAPLFPKNGGRKKLELEQLVSDNVNPTDFYLQRRRTTPDEAQEYVLDKLIDISLNGKNFIEPETEISLEKEMLTLEESAAAIDANDMCSLLIKEWPIAPCNTPLEQFTTMYYENSMEEWPMTTLSTRVASSSDIPLLLEEVSGALLNAPNSRSASYVEIGKSNKLSIPQLLAPPNSKVTIHVVSSEIGTDSNSTIKLPVNNISGW